MRSELINDIFSVETEAERIVAEARQLAREQVSRSHEEGAALVRIAAQEARESRFQAIKEAQRASAKRIDEFQESLGQCEMLIKNPENAIQSYELNQVWGKKPK